MRYGVAIPHANRFATPAAVDRMAAIVEDLGFDSIWTSDHIIVPEGSGYIPEHMLEPLATLSHLAARTTNLTLGISVLVIPYRDPVFTAKYLSSLDVLSGGRLVLGVGVGWLEQEFHALGASFDERGAQTDEYLAVIRNLWETETSSFDGKWKRYDAMRMYPKGAAERRGTIPIWVGGNGGHAHRRAAKLGDGWHPINMSPAELGDGVVAYRAACDAAGREPGPVCLRHMPGRPIGDARAVLTGTPDEKAADIRAYADAGLDELMLSMPWRSLDELASSLRAFMRDVAPRV
ncbi:MAG TPA: LLM class F420-dependent oxidoreductase [Acidimicrobiales bacterium]|nr:LLM class F420-dependent oxidoreductase [Acidimicrobiales bacterium]